MQSGYGGVSDMQQFLVDGCASTLFSIPPPPPPQPATTGNSSGHADIHSGPSQPVLKLYQPLHQPPPPQPQHHPPPSATPYFPHFLPIPITQQLFQQTHHHHHHQFQLFHHQPHQQQDQQRRMLPHHHHHHQLGLDPESGPENSSSPTRLIGGVGVGGVGPHQHPQPSFLTAAMNFKLAVNESSGGGSREGMNDDDGILQGDDGSESRFHPVSWQREEESSAIKEPFWRPLDLDYINSNNKRPCKDKEPESSTNTYCKKNKDADEPPAGGQGNNSTSASNYKLFSELDAICKPGGHSKNNNQDGSGSALTGDENPVVAPTAQAGPASDQNQNHNHGSDTSTGGAEVPPPPPPSKLPKGGGRRKRKRRQQQQQQLSSIAAFFESLVKQLMDHQESLHRKFLEVMERKDQERTSREEAWRKQEAAKSSREAEARAQERVLVATREAAIISFLEKISGESLNLPTKSHFQSLLLDETLQKDEYINTDRNNNHHPMEPSAAFNSNNINIGKLDSSGGNIVLQHNTSRWPRAEVQALIRVRGGLESRFQEPGLKGPLWEEVSTTMASIGYQRSAKRCKEKWENINKYFRKTKDSGKRRPQHSKTCPYFHQLDQLYSKSTLNKPLLSLPPSTSSPNVANASGIAEPRDISSELLDAIVVSTDHTATFRFPEMGQLIMDFSGKEADNAEASGSAIAAKARSNNEEDGDEEDGCADEEEAEGEEGEGDSQGQGEWHEQQQQHDYQRLHA